MRNLQICQLTACRIRGASGARVCQGVTIGLQFPVKNLWLKGFAWLQGVGVCVIRFE
jgi:hypothetical protein